MRVYFLLVCFLVVAVPAKAQEMPAWAAPKELSARQPSPDPEANSANGGSFECDRANPNCTDVVPAPVSEGTALLMLLGAGYAIRRLRRATD